MRDRKVNLGRVHKVNGKGGKDEWRTRLLRADKKKKGNPILSKSEEWPLWEKVGRREEGDEGKGRKGSLKREQIPESPVLKEG